MMFKNILLILPRLYKGKWRLSLHPTAGLGYISESLKRNGFGVEVLDMNLQYTNQDLIHKLTDYKPDLIGFSLMTFGHREVYGIINKIKERYPRLKIAAGGPHLSMLREKVLEDCPGLDYGIILEGDSSIVELCRGKELEKIPGLIYRENGRVIKNDFERFISELDKLSFPKYESFELDKYPTRQIGIVTSRGCPYSCIYCPVISAIGKQFRQRSAPSVIEEIEYWYNKGYREIFILDDNFTLSRKRVEEICKLLGEKDFKGISLKCPNGIRADRVDYKLLKSMRETGFDMIAIGVESAEDRVLKNIKKGESSAIIERTIRDACRLGFDVDLFFMIGFPGEDFNDVRSSFSLAERYPVRAAWFYNIVPFPTTELFEWIREKDYFLKPLDYTLNDGSLYLNKPWFFTLEMSVKEKIKALTMGRAITRKVRRNYIERKLNGPLFFKKIFSLIYTLPFVERLLVNNVLLVRLKERYKKIHRHPIPIP